MKFLPVGLIILFVSVSCVFAQKRCKVSIKICLRGGKKRAREKNRKAIKVFSANSFGAKDHKAANLTKAIQKAID